MTTLEATLTLATSVLNALANLINGAGASTPMPDDSNTPLPTYDEQNDIWSIAQDTADIDGIFKGIYRFALDTACSVLTIQSVTGHTAPANPSFPAARYTDCNDVTHDVTSVNDLTGEQVKHFEIYSDAVFTITLKVTATWEQVFDFTVDSGVADGWYLGNWGDTWVSGSGWRFETYGEGSQRQQLIHLKNDLSIDTNITYVEYTVENQGTHNTYETSPSLHVLSTLLHLNSTQQFRQNFDTRNQPSSGTYNQLDDNDGIITDQIEIAGNPDVAAPDRQFITSITIRGTGTNPFV